MSAMHPDLEGLLDALRSVQPAEGLEARVAGRLEAQAAYQSVAGHRRRVFYGDASRVRWLRTCTPAAALALVCVFAGGFLVARESSIATQGRFGQIEAVRAIAQQAPGPAWIVADRAPTRLTTASARRKPAGQVPAGRHRARATTTATSSSR